MKIYCIKKQSKLHGNGNRNIGVTKLLYLFFKSYYKMHLTCIWEKIWINENITITMW